MIGTILNGTGILAGGLFGLFSKKELPVQSQKRFKLVLGIACIYLAFVMIWRGLPNGFFPTIKALLLGFAALLIGNGIGKWARLQKHLQTLAAQTQIKSGAAAKLNWNEAFSTCAVLFALNPMGIVGAAQEGLFNSVSILIVKSMIDMLSAVSFARFFGWGILLSVIPLVALQGTITLIANQAAPHLMYAGVLDSMQIMMGLLLLCVAVVILEIAKAPLADYLPSLLVAPLLDWLT